MKKLLASLLLTISSLNCFAQWPTKPVTFVIPYAVGSLSTQTAMAVQTEFEKEFKTPMILKYLPGAGSMVAVNAVLNEPNDDHTIILLTDDFFTVQRLQGTNLNEKFVPLNIMTTYSSYVYGNSDSSIDKLKETIKTKGVVNFGNLGVGSGIELWSKQLTHPGMKVNPVPYKGAAPMVTDVLGGHLEYGIGTLATYQQHVKEGKLKLLMTTGLERNHVHKDVPTFRELGFQGEPFVGFLGVFTLADTSADAQEKLAKILRTTVLTQPFFESQSQQGITVANLGQQQSKKVINDTLKRVDKMNKK